MIKKNVETFFLKIKLRCYILLNPVLPKRNCNKRQAIFKSKIDNFYEHNHKEVKTALQWKYAALEILKID